MAPVWGYISRFAFRNLRNEDASAQVSLKEGDLGQKPWKSGPGDTPFGHLDPERRITAEKLCPVVVLQPDEAAVAREDGHLDRATGGPRCECPAQQ